MPKAPAGTHPKWLSCFPGGSYFGDDGSDEPEEEEQGEIHTFLYRNGEQVEEGTYVQRDFRDVLTDLGV